MNEYENFLFELYYSKIQVVGIQSGNIPYPWDVSIQMKIYELPETFKNYEIEAHIIGAKQYFKDQIDYPEILNAIKTCVKQEGQQINENTFSMFIFKYLKNVLNAN